MLPTNGEMLYFLFGQDSSTGGPTFTHTLSTATVSVLPSFSMGVFLDTQDVNDFYRVAKGCQLNSASFTLSEGGELEMSMDIKARGIEAHTNANFSPDPAFVGSQFTTDGVNTPPIPYLFYDRDANISISAPYSRTLARVKSCSWTINNNLKAMYYIQAPTTPTGSTQYSAQDMFNALTSNASFDLSITVVPAGHVNGTGSDAIYDILDPAPGTSPEEQRFDVVIPFKRGGSASDTMVWTFKNCMMSNAPHSLPEDGGPIEVSVTLVPEEITCVVVDTLGNYATLSAST